MATHPHSSRPDAGLEVDPVTGFAYCREMPPDVPPGMTLAEWHHAHHPARPHQDHHLRRLRPGVHHDPHWLHLHHRRRPA